MDQTIKQTNKQNKRADQMLNSSGPFRPIKTSKNCNWNTKFNKRFITLRELIPRPATHTGSQFKN